MSYRGGDRGRGGGDRGRGGRGGGGGGGRGGGGDRGGGFRGGRGGGGGGRGAPAEIRVFRDPSTPFAPPDAQVMNIENTYMQNAGGIGALAKLGVNSSFPGRPGYGTQGRPIAVYANYFRVKVAAQLGLTRYSVEVSPEVKGKKLGRIFELLLAQPEFSRCVSDKRSMVISLQPLNINDGHTVDIVYIADGEDTPLPNATTYKVRAITPTSLDVAGFVDFLSAVTTGSAFPQQLETIQALNVLFGQHPQSNDSVVSIGQNRHFSTNREPKNRHNIQVLGGGLESLRGYFQSVRPAAGGLLLNVNITHGVFLEPEPLNVLMPKLGTGNKATLQKKLGLIRVQVTHLPQKISKQTKQPIPRIKTICGLATPQDGRGGPNPPQIQEFGAGPKGVKVRRGVVFVKGGVVVKE